MRELRIAATGCAALVSLCGTRGTNAEPWTYEAAPFLWAAGLDGRVSFNGPPVDVAASFEDLVDFANVGAAMRVTARRPPVGWFAEASWIETQNHVATGLLTTVQTMAEGGLIYEFDAALAMYGGVRYQSVEGTLDFSPSGRSRHSEEWLDGLVGARWTPLTSQNWVIWARGDVGAGSSDLVWLLEAGGGYRWDVRWAAYMAYRVLDTDYGHTGFLYDVQQSGLLLGFGFRY